MERVGGGKGLPLKAYKSLVERRWTTLPFGLFEGGGRKEGRQGELLV